MHRTGLLLIFVLAAVGAEGLQVRLRPEVEVLRPHATLAEVAILSGDQHWIGVLGGCVVQEMPDARERTVDAGRIRAALAGRIPMRLLAVDGSTVLRRFIESVPGSDLDAVVVAALAARAGEGAEVVLRRCCGDLAIPADIDHSWRASVEPLVAQTVGEVPVRVRLLRGDHEVARTLAVAEVRLLADRPVATRALRRGEVIRWGDLRLERIDLSTGRYEEGSLESLIGMELRRDCPADAPLAQGVLRRPPAVRGGDIVTLEVRRGGLLISTTATALADGAAGEQIQVRRSTDGRSMPAVVSSPGIVVVAE